MSSLLAASDIVPSTRGAGGPGSHVYRDDQPGKAVDTTPGIELLPMLRLSLGTATDSVRGFEIWRRELSGLYEIMLPPDGLANQSFRVDIQSWHLGELVAARAEFSAREQARTPRKIRGDRIDHYRVILQTAGRLRIELDGRELALEAGQLLVTDMSRPERFSVTDGASIVLMISREALEDALPGPMSLHGLVLQGPTACLLAGFLPSLAAQATALRRSDAGPVARSAIQLVAAAIAPSARTLDAARPVVEVNLLRQACRYIELHLTDAALSPQTVCNAFHISRATLYRLFEPLGGVASYIRERRLTHIHGVLESSAMPRPLARLAEDYAFADAAHFSKSFRRMFGYSPSEVVASAAPAGLLASVPAGAAGGPPNISDWLRGMLR